MSQHPVKPLKASDVAPVERLRKICMALPEAAERLSHGEPCWFAGKGKSFANLDNHHHGADHLSVWLPQPPGVQEHLIALDPDRYFRPPYVGGRGWVAVVLDTRPDWKAVERLVREAYLQVATSRLRTLALGIPPNARDPRGEAVKRPKRAAARRSS